MKNIILIGMTGCGKSTIGELLAIKLNYAFYDTDTYIAKLSKKSIQQLFNESEEIFRNYESIACEHLSQKTNVVISTGGGVIKRNRNIKVLQRNAIIVFIDRSLQNIEQDIDYSTRPLLANSPDSLYSLYNQRYPIYKKYANIIITNDTNINNIVDDIAQRISK